MQGLFSHGPTNFSEIPRTGSAPIRSVAIRLWKNIRSIAGFHGVVVLVSWTHTCLVLPRRGHKVVPDFYRLKSPRTGQLLVHGVHLSTCFCLNTQVLHTNYPQPREVGHPPHTHFFDCVALSGKLVVSTRSGIQGRRDLNSRQVAIQSKLYERSCLPHKVVPTTISY